jgi:transcriptional regulator with XRE-family HTH domain
MPRKMKTELPPLESSSPDTIGQRIARVRKTRGWTQVQLAALIGIARTLVTDYETGRLRLNDDMVARFARALGVSADFLLGLSKSTLFPTDPDMKIIKRLKEIEQLPQRQKKSLILTIDNYLKANQSTADDVPGED